jgi:hypothetical protein
MLASDELLGFIRKDMMFSPRLTGLRNALSAQAGHPQSHLVSYLAK